MNMQELSVEVAESHSKHDVVSDAEFGVLHDPSYYVARYNRLCKERKYSEDVRQAYLKGIDLGFDEVL